MYQTLTARLIRIQETVMTTQADVDQLTADLSRIAGEITAEIAGLEEQIASGSEVDTSRLRAAVEALDAIAPPVDTPAADTPAAELP